MGVSIPNYTHAGPIAQNTLKTVTETKKTLRPTPIAFVNGQTCVRRRLAV